jgi:hypothetical protein
VEKLQENTKNNGKSALVEHQNPTLWVVVKRGAQTWGPKVLEGKKIEFIYYTYIKLWTY